jgi:hypothetical protein
VVAHTPNPNTWEDWEFKASLGYIVRPSLKKQQKLLVIAKQKSKGASQALVAHTCNPSYSGGRDQKGHSSKPTPANSPQDPILKKTFTKKGWWSGSRCRPLAQNQYWEKKKEKRTTFKEASQLREHCTSLHMQPSPRNQKQALQPARLVHLVWVWIKKNWI